MARLMLSAPRMPMNSPNTILAVATLIVGVACAPQGQTQKAITEHGTQLEALKTHVSTLQKRIADLEQENRINELLNSGATVAYLTPGADGYSTVQTDFGKITVSLENVQPYANGSRVTLQFGNISSATLTGVKATIEWGKVAAKGGPDTESQRSREVTFTPSFRAGSWTNIPVVLDGIPSTELGFVRVKDVTNRGISLSR